MQPQILVVSDPPHGDVDHDAVSETLGLDVDTTRLKVDFPAPEILAATGPQRAHDIAESLTGAGFHARVVSGHELADIPWPRLATAVAFGPDALSVTVGDGQLTIPYSSTVWAVSCQPPEGFSAQPSITMDEARRQGSGAEVADALEWAHHVDLYARLNGQTERIAIVDDVAHSVEEIERLFHRVTVDRRLEGVRPRQRFVAGEAGFDIDLRKAFSFGTLLLRQVLQSISDELRDVPQYEFASRLSYATRPPASVP